MCVPTGRGVREAGRLAPVRDGGAAVGRAGTAGGIGRGSRRVEICEWSRSLLESPYIGPGREVPLYADRKQAKRSNRDRFSGTGHGVRFINFLCDIIKSVRPTRKVRSVTIAFPKRFDSHLRLYSRSDKPESSELPAMPNPDSQYQNEDGRVLRWEQIVRYGWKEGGEIERTEDGVLVDGELYRPVSDGGHDVL